MLEEDRTTWEPWWELNKEPFLRRKQSVWSGLVQTGSDEFFLGSTRRAIGMDHLQPTDRDIERTVLPALRSALAANDQRDIVTACLVAMAKTGRDHSQFRLVDDVFKHHLASRDHDVRAAAVLAIGISARRDAAHLDLLAQLALDTPAGRRSCERAEVDDRTRAFACCALGLLGEAPADAATRHRAARTLIALVADPKLSSRNVRVAAITALGLIDTRNDESPASRAIADLAVDALGNYYDGDIGRGDELVQAHCPPAIARMVGKDGPRAAAWRQRFAADLAAGIATEGTRGPRRSAAIAQSCALALGTMCTPVEGEDSRDAAIATVLHQAWTDHRDAQTRDFAIMALGRIGGRDNRTRLLKELTRAGRAIELPWVALALGVQAFERRHAGPDVVVGAALLAALRASCSGSARGAIAIAIGLAGHTAASSELLLVLRDSHDDALCGHVCIALALLGEPRAQEDLRAVLGRSLRRPELLRQAAVALSILGDRAVADDLLQRLHGDTNQARLSAVAGALSLIGDRRSIEPLAKLLADADQTALSRAFAAAALGGVADHRLLPWNTVLRGYVNYRATTETLQDGSAGLLDIL